MPIMTKGIGALLGGNRPLPVALAGVTAAPLGVVVKGCHELNH